MTVENDKKICVKCMTEKFLFQFRNFRRAKDGKKSYCIPCDDKYQKEHYLKNKEKRIEQVKQWQKDNAAVLKIKRENKREKEKSRKSAEQGEKLL